LPAGDRSGGVSPPSYPRDACSHPEASPRRRSKKLSFEFCSKAVRYFRQGPVLAANPLLKHHVLAGGIPALSCAAAANPIPGQEWQDRNFNMQTDFMIDEQWTVEGHEGNDGGKWLHSDFRNVALSYVYKMYEKMIELGGLDEE